MMSYLSASSKNHSKKTNSRERDKNKSVASESGGSSQCDTPPLVEKDGAQGKFAGVGADSVLCMAEQIAADINTEAATNLAEDVSYKLRQIISTIALHSEMMKKSCIDGLDVNTVFSLSDTSPVVGACVPHYVAIGEDRTCCEVENLINISEYALVTQSYVFSTLPTVSVEWITDDKSLSNNGTISANLQNYYTRIARAILNLKTKTKQLAVEDLATNTRIGPIFPNLFNLAVLVLNDDNLNALNVPTKKPLQSNVLDMVEALCSNPCSLDTNIQQQFQRLFPVMVSNILGNGSLAEKMVAILTKITRTWPSFIAIGKGILFDYLSQGSKERLTAPMIRCVLALGRHALVECLGDHLEHIDDCVQARVEGLRETIIDTSTCLFRSEPTTYLEDYVMTDYTLYEILGDSVMPRRTIFPVKVKTSLENSRKENTTDEEFTFVAVRPATRRSKVRPLPKTKPRNVNNEPVFETTKFCANKTIRIRINKCRSIEVTRKLDRTQTCCVMNRSGMIASGVLNRFRYKLSKPTPFPIFGALTL